MPTNAFKTIIQLGGIESESDYPYDAQNEKCHFRKSLSHVKINSYVELPKNETYMKNYLFHNGPISIGINANAMQFYFGGISHPPSWLCNPGSLDHGVLIVGYGTGKTRILHQTQPYWIIKNSWGKTWGEKVNMEGTNKQIYNLTNKLFKHRVIIVYIAVVILVALVKWHHQQWSTNLVIPGI